MNRKIKQAFCPPQVLEDNPCVAYVEAIVFPKLGKFEVQRKERDGGDVVYNTIEEFKSAFSNGSLHPGDLKANLSKQINAMLQPVRDHFNVS